VIILSADVTPEARHEALEAGADAFLPKPIEAFRLLEQIQALGVREEAARKVEPAAAPAPVRPAQPAALRPSAINVDTLGHLEELGASPAFVDKLISVFLADSRSLLERIDRALAARDFGAFRSLVHAMKGSSASMGTDRLTRLCDTLGELSDRELRLKGPMPLRALSEEFAAAGTELEAYLKGRRSSAV
jgi:HPt (histidine-containing phosphotransfer) domain-containing protein